MQYDNNNKLCPVGYGGRSLSKQEKNYTVTEIEMLAVLEGIKALSHVSCEQKIHCPDRPLFVEVHQKLTTRHRKIVQMGIISDGI